MRLPLRCTALSPAPFQSAPLPGSGPGTAPDVWEQRWTSPCLMPSAEPLSGADLCPTKLASPSKH